jgi:two-component system chemotaxis sensor kinase CheA
VTDFVDLSIMLQDYIDDAEGHLEAIEATLLDMEKSEASRPDRELTTLLLGSLHTLKGNSGMMGFASIQQYVHQLESAVKLVSEESLSCDTGFFGVLFTAVNAIRDSLRKIGNDPAAPIDFNKEITLLESFTAFNGRSQEPSGETPLPREVNDGLSSLSVRKSNTLKVNFEKFDQLLNLVGELVIHRTALASMEEKIREAVGDWELFESFREISCQIGKITGELRESIMKARMLPVKNTFHRFNRLVRDLSDIHGKEVRLIFQGEETELDKTVLDKIGEPLLHLIRNAIDHGIETPEERRTGRKPATGALVLSAAHESNNIVITVADDGRGMSAEKLKVSAVSKGLINSATAASMADEEAFRLVFLPGFSTNREVTETSGRGIGLDVVKNDIASLNGIIDVTSRPRVGTCFTIRLPLTLSIIHALMVEVSGETFAVPLSGVCESITVPRREIHETGTGEVITLRDRLLPLIRLDRFFALDEHADGEEITVVVAGSGVKRAGIVVDRLVGQQEVVIKALDDYLGDINGISGGTVLGNGKICLILDVAGIIGSMSSKEERYART